jgi:4-amino-4-deoxy-L-arabinose transferase-like glycosyltransferase
MIDILSAEAGRDVIPAVEKQKNMTNSTNRYLVGIVSGAIVLAAGLLLPAQSLVDSLYGPAGDLQEQLLLGASIFKAVLVVTGLYLAVLGFITVNTAVSRQPQESKQGGCAMWLLLALACLALALRLYQLDVGIWLDEMLTYVNYMPLTAGRIFTTFDDANNHLLFTLLANLSFDLFGAHTWSLRLPAVLFGVASIPALYYVARQVGSVREALFSAALFTFSYHHVWFSQNARGYTALLFFTLLSSGLLIQALRSNRTAVWLLYAVSAALGVFTHLTMGFVLIAHFVIWLVPVLTGRLGTGITRWNGFLIGFMVAGLLSLLAYAFVLPQMFGGGLASGAQGTVKEWTNPVWMVLELFRGLQISFAGGLVAAIALSVFALGLIDFLRKAPVIPALLFIPTTLGFLVMLGIGYTLFPRFFFFAMGFGVIIVIRGACVSGDILGKLFRLSGDRAAWPCNLLCAGLVIVSMLSVPFAWGPKQDYEGALALIESQQLPGDTVVTVGIAAVAYDKFYRTGWQPVETLQALGNVRKQPGRTWVVYTVPLHTAAAYPEIVAVLESDFELVGEFHGTLNGGTVVVNRADD